MHKQAAGDQFDDLELSILVAEVIVTEDREQAAQFIALTLVFSVQVTAKQVLQVPYLLLSTVAQICEDLLARREQYGSSYVTVFERKSLRLAAAACAPAFRCSFTRAWYSARHSSISVRCRPRILLRSKTGYSIWLPALRKLRRSSTDNFPSSVHRSSAT